ncbi:MarR family winged helix-turn-helix transcriptional regulator [Microbacterium sp. SLBN-146]|uniref:MarR family winged helix-turn-helix transcriptional regulator n=1 Tax=Microbacterium sp. SLBN-146 TaxID=2768457 RepID=UPI00114DB3FD|nr:MarR family transcriptional regulator [Microbacterium sp. SLBN-146]TQJ31783.1 DNA-binding MarR family transcriptional regulator [Microbacterium sp. SLBN-146]
MSERWVPQTARDHAVLDTLKAVRAFGDALDRMHGGMKGDMDMNSTDLAALRMLIVREQRGESVSPHDLSKHLRISTASTTKLLDRLSAAGHLERHPHPHDRRARVVVLTEGSRASFYRHFGERLTAMRAVAGRYDESELAVVARFLTELGAVLDPT